MSTSDQPSEHVVGHSREFDVNSNDCTIFRPRLTNYFEANNIKDVSRRRAIFLNCLSEDSYRLIFNLCIPKTPEKLGYEELVKLFDGHFGGQRSIFGERRKFYEAQSEPHETIKDWAARVRSLAVHCDFGEELQICLRDRFIMGLPSGQIRDRLFESDNLLTFAEAVKIAESREAALGKSGKSPPFSLKKEAQDLFQVRSRSQVKPANQKEALFYSKLSTYLCYPR